MRTLYIEDVASHGGPESCVGVPRGRSEALTGGVRAGLLSRETTMKIGVPTSSEQAEGNTAGQRFRELLVDPARSENLGTYDELHAREPGDLVVARWVLVMPRPGGFAGWQTDAGRAVRGTLRR
jgi:hypothetical protein